MSISTAPSLSTRVGAFGDSGFRLGVALFLDGFFRTSSHTDLDLLTS